MYVKKLNLFIFIFNNLFFRTQGLDELNLDNYPSIVITDTVLRNTTAALFSDLQIKNQSQKYTQALLVHNFFSNDSLNDHNTLNVIFNISRSERSDDNTGYYMSIINEIFSEALNETEADNEDDILQYIDEFFYNLKGSKEKGIDENYEKLEIKNEIIHILKSDDPSKFNPILQNGTAETNSEDHLSEFWAPSQDSRRIFEGKKTKIKYFPFMASIHIFKSFQCAGSIIKSDLILTAASCLQLAWNNRFFRENPAFLSVRVGSNFFSGGGEDISVLEVYFHPAYTPKNLRNNIACLRLVRHLKFRRKKRKIKKIYIDRNDNPLPLNTDGITIVGWGAKGSSNMLHSAWSNQLSFAVLNVYHTEECEEIYTREYVTKTNFCAGFISKGGGACNHDVGGPGVVNGILTGIISFGSPLCGAPDAPTVFTKVGFYADWIQEIMDQDVPRSYAKTTLMYKDPLPTQPPAYVLPTNFKLEPLSTQKPISVTDTTAAKLSEDDDVLKEFLTTMFRSTEAKEYKELTSSDRDQKHNKFERIQPEKHKDIDKKEFKQKIYQKPTKEQDRFQETVTIGGYRTIMDSFNYEPDDKRVTSQQNGKSRYISSNNSYGSEEKNEEVFTKDLASLINDIDLSDSKERDTDVSISKLINRKGSKTQEESYTRLIENIKPIPKKPKNTSIRDDILALLYLSDNDKLNDTNLIDINNNIRDYDDSLSKGLSIETDGFRDLTFRNNNDTNLMSRYDLDFMSRDELYDILSEAIDDVAN